MSDLIYLVRGETSGLLDNGAPAGVTEWQFSDGPVGHRGYSEDYLDLDAALPRYTGRIIDIAEADFTAEEREDFLQLAAIYAVKVLS